MNSKFTKILFVIVPYIYINSNSIGRFKFRNFKAFPYGLLSLASHIKNKFPKIEVRVLDCNNSDNETYLNDIKKKLEQFNPDIVGLSMMFDNSYSSIKVIAKAIKKYNQNTLVVMGGAATIPSYKTIIKEQPDIDAICFDEGELPLERLLTSGNNIHDFLDEDRSWVTLNSIKTQTPTKNTIKDLSEVVKIDYGLISVSDYSTMKEAFSPFADKTENPKQFFVVSSRGCAFKCRFCLRSTDDDRSIRYASADSIISHVEYLIENYGMNILTFYDDQILYNMPRAKDLFRRLKKYNLRIECPNGISVNFIDEEMAKLMREAGMDSIYLAIESGDKYVLRELMNKPLRLELVKPAIDLLRKYGFWVQGYFVVGMPGETDEHRNETIRFIKNIGLDWASFNLASPSRGSSLYKECVENGYIPKDIKIEELNPNKYFINVPGQSKEATIKKAYMMSLEINFVNNFRMKEGDYPVAIDAFQNVLKRRAGHAFSYYYISKALDGMGNVVQAKEYMNKFYKAVDSDVEWKEYAEHFNLV